MPPRVTRWHVMALAAAVLTVYCVNVTGSERIAVGDGLGWDGQRFSHIILDPRAAVFERAIDGYTIQRVAPNLVVRGLIEIGGAAPTIPNIVRAYMVFNGAMLLVSALLWGAVVRSRELSVRALWFGGAAMYVNVANIKQLSFYATITDTAGLALGMLIFLLYSRRQTGWLAAFALVGAFTWPVALPLILPLILWPRGTAVTPDARSTPLAWFVSGGTAATFVVCFAFVYLVLGRRAVGYGPVAPVVASLLPLSIPTFALVCTFGLRALLRGMDVDYVRRLHRSITPSRAVLAVAVVLVARLALSAMSSRIVPPVLPTSTFFAVLAFSPLTRPFVWLISHIVYFGPWVALTILLWPSIAALVRQEGAGLVAFVSGAFILGFLPESRQAMFVMPVLAALTVIAAERVGVSTRVYIVLAALAVPMSKFWQRFGSGHTFDDLREYFNNQGFYMDARAYAVHAAVAAVVVITTFVLLRADRVRIRAAA